MNNTNPPSPLDSLTPLIVEKVFKLNSLLESLNLVPSSSVSNIGDNNVEEEDELGVEYFDKFPTMSELAYHKNLMCAPIPSLFFRNPIIVRGNPLNLKIPCNIGHIHIEKAYIDLNSHINIMTRAQYNWIRRERLEPREDIESLGIISNFMGRVRGMHFFVGNFTYVSDFVIVEDISSATYPRFSHVVLGKPFVELSNMTYDLSLGLVKFTSGSDEIAYKMPHKIEQYDSLSDMEKEHTKSVYFRNKEGKRKGVDYVMSKILGFYKECLVIGPEYQTGLDGSSSGSGKSNG
ncbi:retrotransposon ORF1 [Tanacetum coccineum]